VTTFSCAVEATSTATALPSPLPPSRTPLPTATDIPSVSTPVEEDLGFSGESLPTFRGDFFVGSGVCAVCHQGLVDEAGSDVSIGTDWRSTMMANASRDPYWQATLHSVVALHPDSAEEIEGLCSRCHMPMAHFTSSALAQTPSILDNGFLNPENPLHGLALDGVSCTLCHQIREEGLGFEQSYNGGFQIDTELEAGKRIVFGPYTVEEQQSQVMEAISGFVPIQGLHLSESELCATCHTLFTPILDAQGSQIGEFPEQVPYFEWWYSDFRQLASCQDCHMPEASGGVRISNTSTIPRSPFAQHTFIGGNAQILRIFEIFGDEFGGTASSDDFSNTLQLTLDQLQNNTAELEVESARLSGSRLTVDLLVTNTTGHKFPTAFPSRRAWLHVTVTDAQGTVIFESGGFTPQGAIVGNDNDENPDSFEQHYRAIVQEEQVQIYEAILRGPEGGLTTDVISVVGYLKDNRILPQGLDKGEAIDAIRVWGRAFEDEDFVAAEDRIQFVVEVSGASAPYTVEVELLFQPISFRWLENLRVFEEGEIARFLDDFDRLPNLPIRIAQVEQDVGE
jgi:hypothetical protein